VILLCPDWPKDKSSKRMGIWVLEKVDCSLPWKAIPTMKATEIGVGVEVEVEVEAKAAAEVGTVGRIGAEDQVLHLKVDPEHHRRRVQDMSPAVRQDRYLALHPQMIVNQKKIRIWM